MSLKDYLDLPQFTETLEGANTEPTLIMPSTLVGAKAHFEGHKICCRLRFALGGAGDEFVSRLIQLLPKVEKDMRLQSPVLENEKRTKGRRERPERKINK
ncbi:hypothetical protein TWF718_001166 [Orbilia javanica]|uniref:Uncharacterized protein n=1 Tax=Orbilia javanica TaxID=47235 RepID=A0AAN8N0B8_9PEZI